MNWIKLVREVYTGVVTGIHHGKFLEMLDLDRDTSCKDIADVVEKMTPEELEVFEREFVTHGTTVMGGAHRLRAMELYAYLKVRETQHYGQFCGFKSSGEPITSKSPVWKGLRFLRWVFRLGRRNGLQRRVESGPAFLENHAHVMQTGNEGRAVDLPAAAGAVAEPDDVGAARAESGGE
jgi:hypothetical protein